MAENENDLLTLEQVRDLYPEGKKPSTRWISKKAGELGCKVPGGPHVLVTGDFLERLRECRISESESSQAAKPSRCTARSSRSETQPEPLSTDGVSEALALAQSLKLEKKQSELKPKPTSGQIVPLKR